MELRDALQKALEFEKRGYDVYKDISIKTKNPLVRRTFAYLAEEEHNHIKEITRYARDEAGVRLDGAGFAGLRDFFNMTLAEFKGGVQLSQTEIQAYENAMALEQSSYDYYRMMLSEAKDASLSSFLRFIIEQERGHYLVLEKTMRFVKDPQHFFAAEEDWSFEG